MLSVQRKYILPEGLAQRLKDAYTPIIALTVYAMVSDLQECIAVGMVDNFTNLILPENLQRS